MPPGLAAVVFVAGIVMLFRLDRPKTGTAGVSPALWIPTMWILIAGSRMVSEWLQTGPQMKSPDQYLDGSPLDRFVLTVLLAAGLVVLARRWRRAAAVLQANAPVVLFFLYCVVSVLWSDYPGIAFKRWMKAVGDFVMVLVVLTEPDPRAAVKRLLARAAFVLIPLSVLFVKYYPELGRGYDRWTWSPYYAGVATGKNALGYVCLVLGLGSLWRWLAAFRCDEGTPAAGPLIAHGAVLAMILWLFWKADSATSVACFLLGGSLLAIASVRTSRERDRSRRSSSACWFCSRRPASSWAREPVSSRRWGATRRSPAARSCGDSCCASRSIRCSAPASRASGSASGSKRSGARIGGIRTRRTTATSRFS